MQRDPDLVRKILLAIRDHEHGYAPQPLEVEGYTIEQVQYHAYIMIQGGLVEGLEGHTFHDQSPRAIATNLTWQGHEFIDAAENETIWTQAKQIVKQQSGALPFEVFKQLLIFLLKDSLGLH